MSQPEPVVWYKRPFPYYASFALAMVIGGTALVATNATEFMSKTEAVTDIECYHGGVLVYEGVARGNVSRPLRGSPWYFTDYITDAVVVRDMCIRSLPRYVLKPGEDGT